MKRIKKLEKRNILIILGAIVLLVSGFFLPEWIFGIQNRKFQTDIVTYTMENGSFHVTNQMIQKTNAITGEYMIMELYDGMKPEHTEKEILDLGIEIVQIFTPWIRNSRGGMGPLRAEISEWSAEPEVVVQENESLSFVVWNLYMVSEGISYSITIDDTTGKMLQYIYYYLDEPYNNSSKLDEETADEWAQQLPEIFKDYYGVETETVELENRISDRDKLEQDGWGDEMLEIVVYRMKDSIDSTEIFCHFGNDYGDINSGSY